MDPKVRFRGSGRGKLDPSTINPFEEDNSCKFYILGAIEFINSLRMKFKNISIGSPDGIRNIPIRQPIHFVTVNIKRE